MEVTSVVKPDKKHKYEQKAAEGTLPTARRGSERPFIAKAGLARSIRPRDIGRHPLPSVIGPGDGAVRAVGRGPPRVRIGPVRLGLGDHRGEGEPEGEGSADHGRSS